MQPKTTLLQDLDRALAEANAPLVNRGPSLLNILLHIPPVILGFNLKLEEGKKRQRLLTVWPGKAMNHPAM